MITIIENLNELHNSIEKTIMLKKKMFIEKVKKNLLLVYSFLIMFILSITILFYNENIKFAYVFLFVFPLYTLFFTVKNINKNIKEISFLYRESFELSFCLNRYLNKKIIEKEAEKKIYDDLKLRIKLLF